MIRAKISVALLLVVVTTITCTQEDINTRGNYTSAAAGSFYSIAMSDGGSLWAWGTNYYGQLGDGTTDAKAQRQFLGNDFATVSAGLGHVLAIKEDGTLWAWGSNNYGQCGIGGPTQRVIVPVKIGSDFVKVAAGALHSLAIKNDGSLWAWGGGSSGQLGDGNYARPPLFQVYFRDKPIKVGEGYETVAAGYNISFAIKTDGTLWSFGNNFKGALGVGTIEEYNSGRRIREYPVLVGTDFAAVAGGQNHAIALKTDGTLWAWGNRENGLVGDGTWCNFCQTFTPLNIGSGFTHISAGSFFSMALKEDGTLWAWGSGMLGDGSSDPKNQPTQVGSGFMAVSAGQYHAMAVGKNGTLWAWGQNAQGELGDGTLHDRPFPVRVIN